MTTTIDHAITACPVCGAALNSQPSATVVELHFPGCTVAQDPVIEPAPKPAPAPAQSRRRSWPAPSAGDRFTVHTTDELGCPDGYFDSTPRTHADAERVKRDGERTSGLSLRLRIVAK